MAEEVGIRFRAVRKVGRAVGYCVSLPVAIGVVGVLLLTQAVFSPRDLVRKYLRDRAGGRWWPLILALRLAGAVAAVVVALPLMIVINCIVVLRSPVAAWQSLKDGRERRRRWRRLRAAGRVLRWEDAKRRVDSGSGTFVAEMDGADLLMGLWWVAGNRREIDPEGRMPSLTDEEFKPLLPADRQRLEGAASRASWVKEARDLSEVDWLDAVGASPNIWIEWPGFEDVALKADGAGA